MMFDSLIQPHYINHILTQGASHFLHLSQNQKDSIEHPYHFVRHKDSYG